MTTALSQGSDEGPFATDVLQLPTTTLAGTGPHNRTRLLLRPRHDGGCTWDGDVWIVSGLSAGTAGCTRTIIAADMQRIASGMFQPLGLKIVDDTIYLTCRDQLVILRDLNGDRETDYYECFNNDHQVTEHFHEFAMGLQRDTAGNFYYAKSARHALKALVPHHGTLLKVSPDGTRTEFWPMDFVRAKESA